MSLEAMRLILLFPFALDLKALQHATSHSRRNVQGLQKP